MQHSISAEQLHVLLHQLLERLKQPLPEMQPIHTQLKDPVPRETRPKKIGILRKSTFDIDSEFYEWLKWMPENVVINCIMWVEELPAAENPPTEDTPAQMIVPKKQRSVTSIPKDGPHGKFWQEMFLEGIIGRQDFRQLMGIPENLSEWSERVREIFGSHSLTHISPADLIEWIEGKSATSGNQDLLKKIKRLAGSYEEFPAGQYFSPFAVGARRQEPTSDEQFLAEHQLP